MVAHRKQGLRERHVNHVLLVHSCGEEKEIRKLRVRKICEPTATPIFVLEAPSERFTFGVVLTTTCLVLTEGCRLRASSPVLALAASISALG